MANSYNLGAIILKSGDWEDVEEALIENSSDFMGFTANSVYELAFVDGVGKVCVKTANESASSIEGFQPVGSFLYTHLEGYKLLAKNSSGIQGSTVILNVSNKQ